MAGTVERFEDQQSIYCFHYPAGYTIQSFEMYPDNIKVDGPILDDSGPMAVRASMGITVEDAAGRTADEVVNQVVAANPSVPMPQSVITLGGEPAVLLLDGIPAQLPNRTLFIVHGDKLYTIGFVP